MVLKGHKDFYKIPQSKQEKTSSTTTLSIMSTLLFTKLKPLYISCNNKTPNSVV